VFGCAADGVYSDITAAAIYRAQADGSDIINLSLGDGPGYSDNSADAIAVARVSALGVIVVSSNGNAGQAGVFSSGSSPSGSTFGFGVASFDNIVSPQLAASIGSTNYKEYLGQLNSGFNFPQSFSASDIVVNSKLILFNFFLYIKLYPSIFTRSIRGCK
jgi:hypothetical protein